MYLFYSRKFLSVTVISAAVHLEDEDPARATKKVVMEIEGAPLTKSGRPFDDTKTHTTCRLPENWIKRPSGWWASPDVEIRMTKTRQCHLNRWYILERGVSWLHHNSKFKFHFSQKSDINCCSEDYCNQTEREKTLFSFSILYAKLSSWYSTVISVTINIDHDKLINIVPPTDIGREEWDG